MQNTTKDKVLGLLAKGISLTCIKRVHGLTINEIVQISNQTQKCVKTKSSTNSTLAKGSSLKVRKKSEQSLTSKVRQLSTKSPDLQSPTQTA